MRGALLLGRVRVLARVEGALHDLLLVGGHPQLVLGLHVHLASHVGAAVGGVARQPFGGIRIGLLLVGRAVHGEQVLGVVCQLAALLGAQVLRAGLPCVR